MEVKQYDEEHLQIAPAMIGVAAVKEIIQEHRKHSTEKGAHLNHSNHSSSLKTDIESPPAKSKLDLLNSI
jgi:hypothetical protein